MDHRRALVTGIGIVVALAPSGVGASGDRVVRKAYAGAGSVMAAAAEAHNYCLDLADRYAGGACFAVRGYRKVSIEVEDASGADVAGRIIVSGGRDVSFCGATRRPVSLPKRQRTLPVVLEVGGCGDPAGTLPTEGVVTASFSHRG